MMRNIVILLTCTFLLTLFVSPVIAGEKNQTCPKRPSCKSIIETTGRQNQIKKNVLFIAIDDLQPMLGCYGSEHIISPSIDKIASRGTVFKSAYCQVPLCNPSRTSVMTGMRPDKTKVYGNGTHFREYKSDIVTLPQHFKQNGYFVAAVGKVYHHSKKMQDSLSWHIQPKYYTNPAPLEYREKENIDYWKKNSAELIEKGYKGINLRKAYPYPYEAPDVEDGELMDGKIADEALSLLDKLEAKNEPFFLAVGFHKPHMAFVAPKKYWDLYKPEDLPQPKRKTLPDNCAEEFGYHSEYFRSYRGVPESGPIPDSVQNKTIHAYSACVSYVDAQIGKIMQALAQKELLENTIVVIWGDNGYMLNDLGIVGKINNYEKALKVPLIIADPEQKGGQSTNSMVEFVDVYPTLCELCGLSVFDQLDGVSLKPLMMNPEQEFKKYVFSQNQCNFFWENYPAKPIEKEMVMGYTVRSENYRYTEWIGVKSKQTKAREFYDYSYNNFETSNEINNPEYNKRIKKLQRELQKEYQSNN